MKLITWVSIFYSSTILEEFFNAFKPNLSQCVLGFAVSHGTTFRLYCCKLWPPPHKAAMLSRLFSSFHRPPAISPHYIASQVHRWRLPLLAPQKSLKSKPRKSRNACIAGIFSCIQTQPQPVCAGLRCEPPYYIPPCVPLLLQALASATRGRYAIKTLLLFPPTSSYFTTLHSVAGSPLEAAIPSTSAKNFFMHSIPISVSVCWASL